MSPVRLRRTPARAALTAAAHARHRRDRAALAAALRRLDSALIQLATVETDTEDTYWRILDVQDGVTAAAHAVQLGHTAHVARVLAAAAALVNSVEKPAPPATARQKWEKALQEAYRAAVGMLQEALPALRVTEPPAPGRGGFAAEWKHGPTHGTVEVCADAFACRINAHGLPNATADRIVAALVGDDHRRFDGSSTLADTSPNSGAYEIWLDDAEQDLCSVYVTGPDSVDVLIDMTTVLFAPTVLALINDAAASG